MVICSRFQYSTQITPMKQIHADQISENQFNPCHQCACQPLVTILHHTDTPVNQYWLFRWLFR